MTLKTLKECKDCNGAGYKIIRNYYNYPISELRWIRVICPTCNGRGYLR